MIQNGFRDQCRVVVRATALFARHVVVRLRAGVLAALIAAAGPGIAQPITPDALDTLPSADIVLLGEIHDNAEHHRNQARALAALAPAAVVFEMLDPEQAAIVNQGAHRGRALGDALGWEDAGWPDFALYEPVFAALGEARVYGMAVPREAARAAFERPLPEVFGDEAARFALDRALPAEEQAAREAVQAAAHCDALPAEMLPGMVAAQRLRDAAFARTALQALDETGGPVVVIAGSGHVRRDRGMPAALALAAPEVSVLAIGQVEVAAPPEALFDLWLVSAAADRADPCAAFAAPAGAG